MPGYWTQPEETAAAFADGWFHSGDVGSVDDDGYVYIVDRIKDMIISGGENIYPAEIESALLRAPDVVECAVIGVPDETVGRGRPRRRRPPPGADCDPEEILRGLRGRLAKYKIPSRSCSSTSSPHRHRKDPQARPARTATSRPRRNPHEHHHDASTN